MRRCVKCGATNVDGLANCGNCGNPLADSPEVEESDYSGVKGIWSNHPHSELGWSAESPSPDRLDESLLSIALNIRRIFILFLYLVFVTVLAKVFDLWVGTFKPGYDAQSAVSLGLVAVICVVGVILLYVAVYRKKLSSES